MSAESLEKLAKLGGADSAGLLWLYGEGWPCRFRRLMQIGYSLWQWLTSKGQFVCVSGRDVPSACGRVSLDVTTSLSCIVKGGCVLRNASLEKIAEQVGFFWNATPSAYLGDAGVLVLYGVQEGQEVVVHVSDDEVKINRYREGYFRAEQAFVDASFDSTIPKVIRLGKNAVGLIMMQNKLDGFIIVPYKLSKDELFLYINAALLPLSSFREVKRNDRMQDNELEFLYNQGKSLKNSKINIKIEKPLKALLEWRRRFFRTNFVAHCDYVFQNILFKQKNGDLEVSGILDWEFSQHYTPVGFDALFLVVRSYSSWKNYDPIMVLAGIWRGDSDPVFSELITMIKGRFLINSDDICFLALEIWIRHLAWHAEDFDKWDPARQQEWLFHPSESAIRWIDTHHAPMGNN